MANSSALNTSNEKVKYRIEVTEGTQSVEENYTNATVKVFAYRTNTGYTTYGTGTIWCKINGTTYSSGLTPNHKITNSGIYLFTKTIKIPHSADGTKSLKVTAWFEIPNIGLSSSEQGFTVTLKTIPRSTTPTTDSSVTLGQSITISTPSASSSFTHALNFKLGDYTLKIASSVKISIEWTAPLEIAEQITKATSAKAYIECITYSDGKKVGTKSIPLTVKIPSSVVPEISSVTLAEGNKNVTLDMYVQNISKIKATIEAKGIYGSTIESISSTLNGVTYKNNFTSDVLSVSGYNYINTTVTDSRGRKATKQTKFAVELYEKPQIKLFAVERCDASGNIREDGECLKVTYRYNIHELLNKNTKKVVFDYAETGQDNFTEFKTLTANYSESASFISDALFSSDNSYTIRIIAYDMFSANGVKQIAEIETDITTFDIHFSGKGMAFGKVAEYEDLLDVNWNVKFRKDVAFANDTEDLIQLPLTKEFVEYSTDFTPRYRVKGRCVEINGAVSPVAVIPAGQTRNIFGNIPKEFAPRLAIRQLCQGSGKNTWQLGIEQNGELSVARYGTTEFIDIPTNAYLVFHITYMYK